MLAHQIMTSTVITARPDDSLARAAQVLTSNGFSALPVVDDQLAFVGIVTEADLIRARYGPSHQSADPTAVPARASVERVGAIMTTPVVAVDHNADVSLVAREMVSTGRRCVPVVDGDRLVGVITRRDVLRLLERTDEAIARDVRSHLQALGDPDRWAVKVDRGEVDITDRRFREADDRYLAVALAEAVPGVIRAKVTAKWQ